MSCPKAALATLLTLIGLNGGGDGGLLPPPPNADIDILVACDLPSY